MPVRSTIPAWVRRAERELDDVATNMFDVAEQAAAHLRATDPYTDRTGDLRDSTVADVNEAGDSIEVVLEMGMHYGKYLAASGWSDFEAVAERADDLMRKGVDRLARKIAGR